MFEYVDVDISPEAEEFNLALPDRWVTVAGHLIKVNQFKFSAVPLKDKFRVSEVGSGCKLLDVLVPESIESYEETMLFLEFRVTPQIVMILTKFGEKEFQQQSDEAKKTAFKRLGKMPITNKLPMDWFKENTGAMLN